MRAFGLAFTLWGGTILLSCFFVAVVSIGMMSLYGIPFAIIGCVVAAIITCPLLVPVTLLINITRKVPYGETIKVIWLGFALVVLNFLFFELLDWALSLEEIQEMLFLMSSISLVFMLFFKWNNLSEFFSEQTENTQS